MSATVHAYKVLDTPTLIKANNTAIDLDQNRSVTFEFIDMLDPDGIHVITFTMGHKNYAGTLGVRCQIYCKVKGSDEPKCVWIDVTHEEFNSFPTVDHP